MAIKRGHLEEIEKLYKIGLGVNISTRQTLRRFGFRSLSLLDGDYVGRSETSVVDDLLREFALGVEAINGNRSELKLYYRNNISFIINNAGQLTNVQFSPEFVLAVGDKNGWVQSQHINAMEDRKDYVRSLFEKYNFDINGSVLALRIATMRDAGIIAQDGRINEELAEAYVIGFIAYKFAGSVTADKKLVKMADKTVHCTNLLIFASTHICAELGKIDYAAMVEKNEQLWNVFNSYG